MKSLIIFLLAFFAISQSVFAQNTQKNELTIFVDGLCGMCKDRIEAAAFKTKGVISANWNQKSKRLKVEFISDKFDENQLHKKISSVGHDTEKMKADDKVYDKLHSCCKYRDVKSDESESEHDNHSNMEQLHENEHENIENQSLNHSLEHENAPLNEKRNSKTNTITGKITELSNNGTKEAVVGANIYWVNTNLGTLSNEKGEFELKKHDSENRLVIRFIGYENDTLLINEFDDLEITLKKGITMEDIDVIYKKKTTELSFTNSIKVLTINQDELKKAACCNLSESFDTNPTIDVSVTDAVTGTKQIQMLGLAGPYVQITRENIPDVRGLASLQGMNYTPGAWIQSIQLNTGTGSVINGYEGITGQINVEIKKPNNSELFYLNIYTNQENKLEVNSNASLKLNEKWSTAFLVHGSFLDTEWDMNKDNFIDHPTMNQKIALNRWLYEHDGWCIQFGAKATFSDTQSGQLSDLNLPNLWQAEMNTERAEAWTKIGKVLNSEQFTSFGFQTSFSQHKQKAFFGKRNFDAEQNNFYANLIFQRDLKFTGNQINTGISFQYDEFTENVNFTEYLRSEAVPGAFIEYTHSKNPKYTFVSGFRADWHSDYGMQFTPRLHFRFAPNELTVIRLAAGKGWRTSSIFAENIGMFASNRQIIIHSENAENPYGLLPEIAYNVGINFSQKAYLGSKELVFLLDLYRTEFQNKIVVNYDQNPQEVHFYNLKGNSYSNSIQTQIDVELFKDFDVRLAYRMNDVKTVYSTDNLRSTPLVSKHRAFINLAYSPKDLFNFDLTVNYQGKKRIPDTYSNPSEYELKEFSPAFFLINSQISKHWKGFELYAGVENLFDFKQENPIISVENPDSEFFDSSLIWCPIFGRKIYAGLRFYINPKKKEVENHEHEHDH